MKALLNHLTKFVSTILELYSPLPIQMSSDLHTLNAYLRTYTQTDEIMLEGFVNRLAQKLEQRLKSRCQGLQSKNLKVEQYDHMLKHHNSCTMKSLEFKLDLPTEITENSFINSSSLQKDSNKPLSYRSNRDKSKDGIKSNRHKFGMRDKNKTLKMLQREENKENIQTNYLNCEKPEKEFQQKDRYLKFIKSEAQLTLPVTNINMIRNRNGSAEGKRQENVIRNKGRYEYKENRTSNNMAQLKIKLKPKSNVDISKLVEGIDDLVIQMNSNGELLNNLMDQIRSYTQQLNGYFEQQQKND